MKKYDGIICGHIHHAEIRQHDEIKYMNDGDWCESCSALIEDHEGNWFIKYYQPL
jgi:UDP-2,3-diacylglucosamine pyrophosphatase LpxH